MFNASEGILTVHEMNDIRDAHVGWCASNTIDPKSDVGLDAAGFLLQAYRNGVRDADELITSLDDHVARRQAPVRVGSSSIESKGT